MSAPANTREKMRMRLANSKQAGLFCCWLVFLFLIVPSVRLSRPGADSLARVYTCRSTGTSPALQLQLPCALCLS